MNGREGRGGEGAGSCLGVGVREFWICTYGSRVKRTHAFYLGSRECPGAISSPRPRRGVETLQLAPECAGHAPPCSRVELSTWFSFRRHPPHSACGGHSRSRLVSHCSPGPSPPERCHSRDLRLGARTARCGRGQSSTAGTDAACFPGGGGKQTAKSFESSHVGVRTCALPVRIKLICPQQHMYALHSSA